MTHLPPTSNITTEFGYAKRDIRLAAYSGIVLQRFVSRKR